MYSRRALHTRFHSGTKLPGPYAVTWVSTLPLGVQDGGGCGWGGLLHSGGQHPHVDRLQHSDAGVQHDATTVSNHDPEQRLNVL